MTYTRDKYGKLVKKPLLAPAKSAGWAAHAAKTGGYVSIKFGKTKCQFSTPYPPQLDKALSVPHPGFQFTTAYKNGHWDGLHHFITRAGYFPTGLLPVVTHILRTGKNPLIEEGKKGHIVLENPPGKTGFSYDKNDREFFNDALKDAYMNDFKIAMDSLNDEGVFVLPIEIFEDWATFRPCSPLSHPLLQLARNLHKKTKLS
jgi:hypothetical protein